MLGLQLTAEQKEKIIIREINQLNKVVQLLEQIRRLDSENEILKLQREDFKTSIKEILIKE